MDFAAQREYLGALGFLSTHGGEPVGAFEDNLRNVGVGLHVVEHGGPFEQTFYRRERRTGSGLAAMAFDGGHQRGFLAADKCAGTQTQLNVKVESGAQDVFAQQAVFTGLADGDFQTFYCGYSART